MNAEHHHVHYNQVTVGPTYSCLSQIEEYHHMDLIGEGDQELLFERETDLLSS